MRTRGAIAFLLAAAAACRQSPPMGQYGPYPKQPMHVVLNSGDTLSMYRLKVWQFRDGSPPAVQLEYEPPFSVADTAAVRTEAHRIWPVMAPYVEKNGFTAAVITATNLKVGGSSAANVVSAQSYGHTLTQSAGGRWRMVGESSDMPPSEGAGPGQLLTAGGDPLPVLMPKTTPPSPSH